MTTMNPTRVQPSRTLRPRISITDIVATYGMHAIETRIAVLRASGQHHAATVIERELRQTRRDRTEQSEGHTQ
ncbi:hypothetical protein [Nocardia sp. NPDC050710]|uniref:hypothetical protein n=1 Tax=Nocardia sp. NPDC050710 TaxID=3157220 RepID=UPI0033E60C32